MTYLYAVFLMNKILFLSSLWVSFTHMRVSTKKSHMLPYFLLKALEFSFYRRILSSDRSGFVCVG